ncbi:MAG TPA: PIN domain-containing protein [Chloroflexi bacterium]|nr:PIN domain-containing protein [Chloroflexota bacterium]
MTKALFVDTGAWLAILDPRDKYHGLATAFYQEALVLYPRLTLTNLVAAETYVSVLRNAGYHKALAFLDILEQSSSIECVWSDRELEMQARDILRRYDDQAFSYTDAVSFALMEQMDLPEAFAFDNHFSVAGFTRLPTE